MGNLECEKGNYKKAAEFELIAYNKFQHLGFIELWNLIYSEQIEVANKWAKLLEENEPGWWIVERGYLYSIEGDMEKAEQLFNRFMKEFLKGAVRFPRGARTDATPPERDGQVVKKKVPFGAPFPKGISTLRGDTPEAKPYNGFSGTQISTLKVCGFSLVCSSG